MFENLQGSSLDRRSFLRGSAMFAAAIGLSVLPAFAQQEQKPKPEEGEKKEEQEERKKDYYLSERRYGSFQRSFAVPDSVDTDKIEAKFVNGVLTVRLPKSATAQKNEKKIAIKKG